MPAARGVVGRAALVAGRTPAGDACVVAQEKKPRRWSCPTDCAAVAAPSDPGRRVACIRADGPPGSSHARRSPCRDNATNATGLEWHDERWHGDVCREPDGNFHCPVDCSRTHGSVRRTVSRRARRRAVAARSFATRAALGQATPGAAWLGLRAAVLAGQAWRTLRCSEGDVPGHRCRSRTTTERRPSSWRSLRRRPRRQQGRVGPRVPLLQGARRRQRRGRRRGPGARARGLRGSHPIAERRALRRRVRDARGAAPRRPRGRDVISQGHDALARPLGFDGQRPRPGARAPGEPRGVLRAAAISPKRVAFELPTASASSATIAVDARRRVVPAGVRRPLGAWLTARAGVRVGERGVAACGSAAPRAGRPY